MLAIPRGGVVIGAVLARELGAELDIVLARKLRAPEQPELAIGAISENGQVYLNPQAEEVLELSEAYLAEERQQTKRAMLSWRIEACAPSRRAESAHAGGAPGDGISEGASGTPSRLAPLRAETACRSVTA